MIIANGDVGKREDGWAGRGEGVRTVDGKERREGDGWGGIGDENTACIPMLIGHVNR